MNIRQIIAVGSLLCVCVSTAAAEPATPTRPLVLEATARPADGPALPVECVVDFGPALPISALAFNDQGSLLAVGGYREVLLWDLDTAKLARRIGTEQLGGMVHAVAFIEGGKALAVGDGVPHESGAVRIFNVETGEPTATFDEPQRVVCCLALSSDGKLLAAGDAASTVHVWDLATGKLAHTIESHKGWVLGAAFSADGKWLATAGADRSLQLRDAATWKQVLRYDMPATVHGVAFSPDGNTVVGAVGGAGEWALRSGRISTDVQQATRRKPTARPMSTGTGMPLDVIWPAKGNLAFVALADPTVRAYASTRVMATLKGHTDWVYCVAATPDGSKLASGSADGTVKLWSTAGGKPQATTLVQLHPGSDDWLIMTPQAYYTASASSAIRWRKAGSTERLNEVPDQYNNAERVRETLAEKATTATARRKPATTRRQPKK